MNDLESGTEEYENAYRLSSYPRYDAAVLGFRNYWYPVMFSRKLRKKPIALKIFGEKFVFIRDQGKVFALNDRCLHRGVPLSMGSQYAPGTISCRYHGWTYDLKSGELVATLSDSPDSAICGKVKVAVYPVEEKAGIIWLYYNGEEPAPQVEADIPPEMLEPDRVILGVAKVRPGNWRDAMENAMDEAHARILHRTTLWTLCREQPAWTKYQLALTNDSEPWVIRKYEQVTWQDQYPRIGAWPPKHFWYLWKFGGGSIAGRLPCIIKNGPPGGITFYNFWVPVDETHYLRFTTMTLRATGLKALRFRIWYWLYARWSRFVIFSRQDEKIIENTNTPPERLFKPDISILYWRRHCELRARGATKLNAGERQERRPAIGGI